jgi:hypothetical protein
MDNYSKKIDDYQHKVASKFTSNIIAQVAYEIVGIKLSDEQVTYLVQLLKLKKNKEQALEPSDYFQIPVQLLFTLMTPFKATEYSNRNLQRYMGTVTKNTIEPLANIVSYTGYNKEYCRRFKVTEEFYEKVDNYVSDILEYKEVSPEFLRSNDNVGTKPAKWGGPDIKLSDLPVSTKATWQKLRNSKFRFDLDLFNSSKGKEFVRSLNLNKYQRSSLMFAMNEMVITNDPQYHDSYFLQKPGRLHTRGGPMALVTKFRKQFIKATDPSNYCLEVDLKCAQLLVLCDILGAASVKEQIAHIIRTESIWKYIGSESLPKDIKKIIVYGFCFGAKLSELPYLASRRAKVKYNLDYQVDKKVVEDCFTGILKPLLSLRDEWLSQYTSDLIEKPKSIKLIHTNSLGLKFNLKNELEDYKVEIREGRFDKTKMAAKLLAFYCQGREQSIIQRLISESIVENIVTYSYDGLTVESKDSEVSYQRLVEWISKEEVEFLLEKEVYK